MDHIKQLMEEYNDNLPIYKKINEIVVEKLNSFSQDFNALINSITSRVKTEKSFGCFFREYTKSKTSRLFIFYSVEFM